MNNIENLKSKIEDLKKEQNRILRGFGGRYSYRSRLDPKNKKSVKSSTSRIKSAKSRLIDIGGEIKDIERELEHAELQGVKSSREFNESYSDLLKQFNS